MKLPVLFVLFTAVVSARAGGDPEGKNNLAGKSDLPQGAEGLAAKYPGDRGIAEAEGVIFADDFEDGAPGAWKRWDEATDAKKNILAAADPADQTGRLGKACLQVTATLAKDNGGGLTKWFASADTLHFRFYTKFDPDCDYVHHFCTLRANKSLQGGDRWSGFGGAGEKPDGAARFSTALEPWGNWGKEPAPGKWNFYSYWHTMSAAPDGKFWGNAFRPAEQPVIRKGEWICCEFLLKHNTPGQADGEQAFWIDGELRGHWKGIDWRTAPGLRANAFTLESYITSNWTKNPVNIVSFDNVVIARSYIGPTPAVKK